MIHPAIQVSNLGKRYQVDPIRGRGLPSRHDTLRDALSEGTAAFLRRVAYAGHKRSSLDNGSLWALRDVSLDIQPGEVVGIIGSNGAGKSTLLKILSRVTAPTTGWARLRGRVGSLLEVGTGFHQELTGRENIYLSGAILGMRRADIRRKFDLIVQFAEVERFIDAPVKRYSSGMYLRLAFAVAAHLESEILLVDEVLAVGDAAFQKKCLGKMDDVAQEGRTVLFVSHNMDAIQRLCPRSLLIEQGQVVAYDESETVVAQYISASGARPKPNTWIDLSTGRRRKGTGDARFTAVRYSSLDETVAYQAYPAGPLEFTIEIASTAERPVESLAVLLSTRNGTKLINADTILQGVALRLKEGPNIVRIRIKEVHLNPGVYLVGLWLSRSPGAVLDFVQSAFEIEVVPTRSRSLGATPPFDGVVACSFEVLPGP